ncbi:MAG: type IX secretion system outer membrane channel protein PorV [Bacteroidetes bacterium]|nr:type IX secretion system outer membrane channel protein PorV [Bacteroidota bacterium]
MMNRIDFLGNKKTYALLALSFLFVEGYGQLSTQSKDKFSSVGLNPITTSVPFLLIAPESRGGAMGDAGVASSPDAVYMHWNAYKLDFIEKQTGVSIAYTPWLKTLVPDINLGYVSFFHRLNSKGTMGGSLRYFSLGKIDFTDQNGASLGSRTPNELAVDLGYAHKLSKNFSGAFSLRYIYSNLTQGVDASTKPASTVAADLSGYYRTDIKIGKNKGLYAAGINISNLGGKVGYTDSGKRNFIPMNLKLGTSLSLDIDDYNKITFMVDFNKLLVPTLPIYAKDSTGAYIKNSDGSLVINEGDGMDPNVSVAQGVFQSFYDAPDGWKEELQEINISGGLEYVYDKQFALRAGYFYEAPNKGNRQYFTMGAGLKYSIFNLDFSYLVSMLRNNPLDNTLRFTLSFNFDDIKAAEEKSE